MTAAFESTSDEDEDDEEVDLVGEDDEDVYDWFAMNTEAGMQEISKKKVSDSQT